MLRLLTVAAFSTALVGTLMLTPSILRADHDDHDRVYQDRDHHDEHHWDKHEDRAYRIWVKDQHRHYENFDRLRAEDQAAYWNWRHEHSDTVLHIDIR
jgi:hypothetical protein